MDAQKVLAILDSYANLVLSFQDAFTALCSAGCTMVEAQMLLDNKETINEEVL